ncbi:hypothetical protein GCM10011316_16790 [Roseibium aquae]|uniref:Formyl transferase N-terminal domain-containing protein n=1 Tax=Roseibium aquae TaxID=1323746 RepID=A0A916X0Y2_9HYPH|nr:formyltransferase family protein [Roseibium aquae]GGB45395.1 hypothetical protein GCM10011316_16790 [Roseibium aquae]
MSICLITGSHPRHLFLARELIRTGTVCAWIMEEREAFVPEPPPGLAPDLAGLFNHHFAERDRIEQLVFTRAGGPDKTPDFVVGTSGLNDPETIAFARNSGPQLVVSYGCSKLSEGFLRTVGCRFWNVHGGLSPDYRGVATHFWPSYFLEPQMTGVTLHETTDFLDSGALILTTSAPMTRGDSLHRLAARNIEHFAEVFCRSVRGLDFASLPDGKPQKKYGKAFLSGDWRPEHLRLIYEVHDDRIVDHVLDGKLTGRVPRLMSVLD